MFADSIDNTPALQTLLHVLERVATYSRWRDVVAAREDFLVEPVPDAEREGKGVFSFQVNDGEGVYLFRLETCSIGDEPRLVIAGNEPECGCPMYHCDHIIAIARFAANPALTSVATPGM